MSITNGQTATAADFVTTSGGAGDSGKVAKLNASGKHDKSFRARFGVRAKQNSGAAIADNVVIPFQAEDFDDDSMHDNVTNNSRLTFNTAGYWMVGASVSGTGGTANSIALILRLNGTTAIAGGAVTSVTATTKMGGALCTIRHFAASDYVELVGYGSATPSSSGDEATNFWAILIAAD